ncbi:MAG: hypothetical protein P8P74_16015 [Crocinitomicaceae bacterium]|nr:hypothetical protein [Crocinitomicaceae bacterium]
MKMNRFFALSVIALLSMAMLAGCRKKEDTIAEITVRDASNQAVAGARVVIYGQSTTNQPANVVLYDTTMTNSSGVAVFNFNDVYQLGQAGVAVLNIDVQKDALTGQGIIKVEQEVTSTETVYVQ